MNISNSKRKLVTIFSLLCFLFAFGIAGYEESYRKGKIKSNDFTISQSLAFGNDPALVTLFTLGTLSYIYLLIIRSPKTLLYPRIFLQVVIYTFLITIIWITTFKDMYKHFMFAGIIFFSTLIYHVLTYIAFRKKSVSTFFKNSLLTACILNLLVFIGLGISGSTSLSKYKESQITFASLENSTVVISGTVLFMIGFMS
tara:strand:- start:1641 stop:2237 length:597 start_codon:yes stop_codon:yes gene_type:complete